MFGVFGDYYEIDDGQDCEYYDVYCVVVVDYEFVECGDYFVGCFVVVLVIEQDYVGGGYVQCQVQYGGDQQYDWEDGEVEWLFYIDYCQQYYQ